VAIPMLVVITAGTRADFPQFSDVEKYVVH
jgi:hypothetical protein